MVGRFAICGSKTIIGDVTLCSPLSMDGVLKNHVESETGSTFHGVRLSKHGDYPELVGEHPHFQFLVLACEVGGHLSEECHTLLKQLVKCRASFHPAQLRPFFKNMFKRRWYGIFSCAIQRAVAWNISGSGEMQLAPLHALISRSSVRPASIYRRSVACLAEPVVALDLCGLYSDVSPR